MNRATTEWMREKGEGGSRKTGMVSPDLDSDGYRYGVLRSASLDKREAG